MYNEHKKEYLLNYQREKQDTITIRVPKGKREEYRAKAAEHGKSLVRYVMDLIEGDE